MTAFGTNSTLVRDVVYAVRQFGRNPGFTIAILLTLALGIGVNATMFRLVDAVVLRPLDGVRDPGRVVEAAGSTMSYPAYLDLRDENPALAGLAAYRQRPIAWRGDAGAEMVAGSIVTGNYFSVVGATPRLGRALEAADERPDAQPVAMVSHDFWRRALGGDPTAVGRDLVLNNTTVRVVGVAQPGFRGTRLSTTPDVWVPVSAWPAMSGSNIDRRGWMWLTPVGRLAPGASVGQAQSALDASLRRQREMHPAETPGDYELPLYPASVAATGVDTRGTVVNLMLLLAAIAGAVLLIGCANVANLLMARALQRRKEIAVRMALGAGGARLTRQLTTEALVLCLAAGALGLLVVQAAVAVAARYTLPGGISLATLNLGLDGRVLLVTGGLALLTGILFGLAPALQAMRTDSALLLRSGVSTPTRAQGTFRGAILTAQVALTLVLLVGAGLFTRTMRNALALDLGFRTDVGLAAVSAGAGGYDIPEAERFYREATERVTALPGVQAVSWTAFVPLTEAVASDYVTIPGYQPAEGENPEAEINYVGAGYLQTLGIGLVSGREFEARDAGDAPRVAMVNETMAQRYWPGQEPVGQPFVIDGDSYTVVGVVKDVTYRTPNEDPRPYAYMPFAQHMDGPGLGAMTMLVRTSGPPARVLEAVREEIRRVGPNIPVTLNGTLAERFAAVLMPQRIGTALLTVFGLLALVIAAVGTYGLTAFMVGQRIREIGIRTMLGAPPASMLRLMLVRGAVPVVVGVAAGIVLALVAGRLTQSFLYGVEATDPITFAATALLLLAVALLAVLLPARRAIRMSSGVALRYE